MLLELLKSNSAPVVVSPTSLKSNTPLGSLVPIPIRGLSPDLEMNKTSFKSPAVVVPIEMDIFLLLVLKPI